MISVLLSKVVILIFGTLFPAYYSYKAVKTKNVKEYVKWMMYWIVFAFFTCAETVTDILVSFWFPFYYEIKILVVLWLLSPATRGSSILYRKFVHPWLTRREPEIDECISKAKEQGYTAVMQLGSKGVNYATNVIMQTAIRGGGGIVSQLKRSQSVADISDEPDTRLRAIQMDEDYMDDPDYYPGQTPVDNSGNRNAGRRIQVPGTPLLQSVEHEADPYEMSDDDVDVVYTKTRSKRKVKKRQ